MNKTSGLVQVQDDQQDWDLCLSFGLRLVMYIAVSALTLIIVSLILKYLRDCGNVATAEQVTATETNQLLPKDVISLKYGTYKEEQEDGAKEAGRWSSSSSEEAYDGNICAVCYEQQRNCVFVPCGHGATCFVCAQRIMDGESKTCPLCRRLIRKVMKLFTL